MDRENRELVLAELKSFAGKILWHTVFILFLALTVWASIKNWHGTDSIERFFYLVITMLGGFCTGGCFIKLYLPRLVGFFADSLLSPKKYLKKAAPLLSHPRNLILQKNYAEAEENLLALLEEYPGESRIVLLLLEMYAVHTGEKNKGEQLCREFFASEKRQPSPQNLAILLLYLDILAEKEFFTEALALIHREENSKLYSAEDRVSLEKRAEGIRNMMKTTQHTVR